MRKLVMGCAVAGIIAFSPRSEARLPASLVPLPLLCRALPKGEVGLASWYGIERQGKPTASGEPFDMQKFTAAHRKLPLGTTVRVTNLSNLKSTLLRVNDRGPAPQDRVIDVSRVAAKTLGFVGAGLTMVSVEVVHYPRSYFQETLRPRCQHLN
jgi:peptidoglycan lytic transglycosylase